MCFEAFEKVCIYASTFDEGGTEGAWVSNSNMVSTPVFGFHGEVIKM